MLIADLSAYHYVTILNIVEQLVVNNYRDMLFVRTGQRGHSSGLKTYDTEEPVIVLDTLQVAYHNSKKKSTVVVITL